MWKKLIIMLTLFGFMGMGSAGTLRGKIENGTRDGIVPTDLQVFLNIYKRDGQNTTPISSDKFTKINRKGEFVFKDLEVTPGIFYEPMVTYKNVRYYGPMVELTKEKPNAKSNVKIYETTTSDSTIEVLRHHILLLPAKGILNVREIMVLTNRSDRTYVGKEPTASGKFRTITFRLPKGAQNIQLGEGAMSCCIEFEKGGFYDTMEFPPGQKQVTFDYRLDVDEKEIELVKPITLVTRELDFIPMEPTLQISGGGLKLQNLANTKVRMYVAQNFKKGDAVKITIAGLIPKPTNPGFVLLGLFTGLLLIGGVVALRKYKQTQRQAQESISDDAVKTQAPLPQSTADQLVREIAILDEMFEENKIDPKVYEQKRKELKERLKIMLTTTEK